MNNNSAFAALGNLTAPHQKEAYFGDAWNALKGGVKSTVDNTYNAAAKGMGQMKDDAYNAGAAGVQQAKQMGQQGLQAAGQMRDDAYNAGAAGVQQAVQGAQTMGLKARAGAINAVDRGVDASLNAVNNNLSRPLYGAAGAIGRGAQTMFQAGMDQHGNAFGKSGTAFDALGMEKEALDQAIAKGLRAGGRALGRFGAAAGAKNTEKRRNLAAAGSGSNGTADDVAEAISSRLPGIGRQRLGSQLEGLSTKIDDTPWLKNTINAAGVTGVGAGAYGIGSGRGERRGIGKGLTEGIGIGAAHAYQPDPGVLGRLGQLFTGTPQADMSALDAWLNENKDEVIKKILSRK